MPPLNSRSLATGAIAVTALGVALAAALLLLTRKSAPPPVASAAPGSPAPTLPTPARAATAEASARNPLDASAQFIDAARRARAWRADAEIAEVRLDVQSGAPYGPIEVRYGQPRGSVGPSSPLGPARLVLTYADQGAPEQKETRTTEAQVSLPEPNCPLEAAYRAAVQSGITEDATLTIRYQYHAQVHRPVWSVRAADGSAQRLVDGSTCSIIVR